MSDKEDMLFAKLAVEFGFIDNSKLATCIQQKTLLQRQGKQLSLKDFLLSQGYINLSQMEILKKSSFGRYKIISEIGRGGMGSVYKAFDPSLERIVALKRLLSPDSSVAVARFLREAKTTARLKHPHIVAVYDIGNEHGENFFTMDFVEGKSLDQLKKSLSTRNVVEIMVKICRAVDYAHKEGVIHRDLKPANIMIDPNREPKVMDFGLAKVTQVSKDLSRSGTIIGTLRYMAPEQAEGKHREVDKTTDVYALGAICYEMLVGNPPFTATTMSEMIHQILHKAPIPPSEVKRKISKDLENICLKALHKEKSKRYRSAGALADDLERFLGGDKVKARRQSPLLEKLRTHKIWLIAILAIVVANTAFLLLFMKNSATTNQNQTTTSKTTPEQKTESVVDSIMQQVSMETTESTKEDYVLRLLKADNYQEQLQQYLQSGNLPQRLLAIEALGKSKPQAAQGEKISQIFLNRLQSLNAFQDYQQVRELIWALGRLQKSDAFPTIYQLRNQLGKSHPLRRETAIPYNWLAQQNNEVVEQIIDTTALKSASDSEFLINHYHGNNLRIELTINYQQPGSIIDTVGIGRAHLGAFNLMLWTGNHLRLAVFNPKIKSPSVDQHGWHHVLSPKPLEANTDIKITVIAYQGKQTLEVSGQPKVEMELQTALFGPMYIGDFPFDQSTKYGSMTGNLRIDYLGKHIP